MKKIGIFSIIILVLVLIFIWLRMIYNRIYNRITFEFGFRGADVSGLNIQSLLLGGQTDATIKMSAKVINLNGFSFSFSDLRAWLYYDNTLIAQTSENLAKQQIIVQKNSSAEIVDDVKIFFNKSSVKMLKEVALKQQPKVQYTVKLKIWGVPISFTDYFIWEF